MKRTKVAIACQGGGSQTAFTAGVLKALFEAGVHERFEIASLSGTSGGAVCAFLIWYGLKKGDDPVWKRLVDFWEDNSAQTGNEKLFNDAAIKALEWTSKGLLPSYNISPSSPLSKAFLQLSTMGLRDRFTDFAALLRHHIDFQELESWGPQPESPVLLLGACNILSGKLHKFNSYRESIRIEHILASACVPTIFPAVVIDGMAYWDGLFSDNPPISALIKPEFVGTGNIPEEIWVIKVNPTTRKEIPVEADDIADRQNELVGNVSLLQGLEKIEYLNSLFLRGAFTEEFLKPHSITQPIRIPKVFAEDPDQPYHIPLIAMSEELAQSLNYESKLDRDYGLIRRLIEDGEKQARKFLTERDRMVTPDAAPRTR